MFVEEDIAQLEIAMDDAVLMQVLRAGEDWDHEIARLGLGIGSSLFDNVVERSVAAELESEVDVGIVSKQSSNLTTWMWSTDLWIMISARIFWRFLRDLAMADLAMTLKALRRPSGSTAM